MIAASKPSEKEIMVKVILNLLNQHRPPATAAKSKKMLQE